jgi:hypothetical protein
VVARIQQSKEFFNPCPRKNYPDGVGIQRDGQEKGVGIQGSGNESLTNPWSNGEFD